MPAWQNDLQETTQQTRKTTTTLLASAALALFIGGCATSSGTKLQASKISQIKKGVTTRADLDALLGKPTGVTVAGDGKQVVSYNYQKTREGVGMTAMRAASFMPFLGFVPTAAALGAAQVSGVTVSGQSLVVRLTKDGRVEDYTISEGASSSGTPFGGVHGITSTAKN